MRHKLETQILDLSVIHQSQLYIGYLYICKLGPPGNNKPNNQLHTLTQQLLTILNNNTTTTWKTYINKRTSQPRNNKGWPTKLVTDIKVCPHNPKTENTCI